MLGKIGSQYSNNPINMIIISHKKCLSKKLKINMFLIVVLNSGNTVSTPLKYKYKLPQESPCQVWNRIEFFFPCDEYILFVFFLFVLEKKYVLLKIEAQNLRTSHTDQLSHFYFLWVFRLFCKFISIYMQII